MQGFLRRRTPYTILPTPLPAETGSSALNDLYFTDSPTQDAVSVMDACLHNLYDVPRAKHIFEQLRSEGRGDTFLDARVYNSLIDAYLKMVSAPTTQDREMWLNSAWELYNGMEEGREKAHPTANTYALMLLAYLRFHPDSMQAGDAAVRCGAETHDPESMLRHIIEHQIPVSLVVADRAFQSSEEANEVIRLLSRAAVNMGLAKVVNELGMAESLGRQGLDPLEDVPEAIPVMKPKKPSINVIHSEDGSVVDIDVSESPEIETEIPFNLDTLRKHLSQVVFARRVMPDDVAARQKLLEDSVYDVAVKQMEHQAKMLEDLGLDNQRGLKHVDLQTWMWAWHQKLQVRLAAEIQNLVEEEHRLGGEYLYMAQRSPSSNVAYSDKVKHALSPFLTLLKPEKLSLITILELMNLQGTGGVSDGMKTARALLGVGRAVELEHKAQMCKKNNIAIPQSQFARADTSIFTRLGYRDLQARRVAARKYMEDAEDWTSDWSQLVRVKVGGFLVDCLMDVATVTRSLADAKGEEVYSEEQPAFFHSYEYVRGHKLGVIKLNPVVAERMARDRIKTTLHPRHLPMLIKPKPWLGPDQGGYLFNKTAAMRFKDSVEQLNYLRHASAAGNLELIYASLDVLGSTPWKINRGIFEIVLSVWNSGKRMCKIPPIVSDLPEPERPENYDTDQHARSIFLQRHKLYSQQKANNHSDRCSVNYKIEIARAFLGDTIYMPHNVDFRGRAYPVPPHLSHIGDDLSRGLLLFGEGKPLGERGFWWLKVHLANLYGFDKGSFDERIAFVEQHLEDIYDSVDHPLDGRMWWTKADDPWQCLATCMEIKAAIDSGDPHSYECSLPIHQDGTCNGLQHYAALGGDAQGAAQVNLAVTDRPSDVYTFVADMVEERLREDLAKGNKQARLLIGKVARKVVKQTVMTTVYGVTFIGARAQIEKQLAARGDIPAEECWEASAYLAKHVLGSIGDLFRGAKDIQLWLTSCARLIAKSIPAERVPNACGVVEEKKRGRAAAKKSPEARLKMEQMTSVVWTTPLGLPIVQPYRTTKRKQIMTGLQTVFISDPNQPSSVNSMKQATAFPPNFIHSLDATHMMLTALECRAQGLTFASVHDSYWTHAGDIDKMSVIIRDTFIALHSSDVLNKLHEEFRERYKGYKVPIAALRGTPALKKALALARVNSDEVSRVAGNDAPEKEPELALSEGEDVEAGSAEEVEDAPKKRRALPRKPKAAPEDEQDPSEDGFYTGRFVDLLDVLPDVPQKGDFDVKTIKKSLYFFS
ncbi:DNA/RNA polymerase [Obba rivulosa]|uniref:DNA-directed RNA polymerase n=1 Tax=Obba rivulosa TaxID=1052685 RepID=A0A8E2DJR6_9APHY|nr:DNA/RNA polymerase [Obba rivulosa]